MNFNEQEQNYIESDAEREAGHVDTREADNVCDKRGCKPDILDVSVAG